jgi:hypothetical protein
MVKEFGEVLAWELTFVIQHPGPDGMNCTSTMLAIHGQFGPPTFLTELRTQGIAVGVHIWMGNGPFPGMGIAICPKASAEFFERLVAHVLQDLWKRPVNGSATLRRIGRGFGSITFLDNPLSKVVSAFGDIPLRDGCFAGIFATILAQEPTQVSRVYLFMNGVEKTGPNAIYRHPPLCGIVGALGP